MDFWYETISVFLISGIKFFAAPLLAKTFGFTYLETIFVTTLGGVVGIFVFFNLGSRIVNFFPNFFKPVNTKRNIFTKKNKFYVKLIRNYGLFGIAIFSPVLISIPVGSFLAARFFENQKIMALTIMCAAVLFWSVSISTFLFLL
tara:strand:+ start:190 stop:624 length:435 start_codon:yes stop_codon:yes gene_type:complete